MHSQLPKTFAASAGKPQAIEPVPPYRLVIFDIDGTLVDSFGWFVAVVNDVAIRHGFRQVDEAEGLALRGMDAAAILRRLRIAPWKLPAIAADMRARKLDAAGQLPLFDGACELLSRLHALGIVLGVVSSDSEDSVRLTLGATTCAQIEQFRCNAPLFGKARKLKAVLRATGMRPDEAIYIGDELRDAAAARQAGIAFGAATWGYATPEALAACFPNVTFRTIGDVARLAG